MKGAWRPSSPPRTDPLQGGRPAAVPVRSGSRQKTSAERSSGWKLDFSAGIACSATVCGVRIHGVPSCLDCMLFRGCLPIMSGWSMAQPLQAHEIDCTTVKPFLLSNAERVKAHAVALAREHGRPFEYLSSKLRKEDGARKIAERDGIDEGWVCGFSALEPCRTFSLRFATGQPNVQSAKRKCLHLYCYFVDRDPGVLHVRVQAASARSSSTTAGPPACRTCSRPAMR